MEEFEIFSHALINSGESDSLFISLKTEQDIGIQNIKPMSLSLEESFSSISPYVIFDFVDGNGDIVNHIKPNPSAKFFLDVGRSDLTLSRLSLSLTSVSLSTQRAGSTEQIQCRFIFSHSGWEEMVSTRHNKSWADASHSDMAADIVSGMSFSSVDITPTTTKEELMIQPHWDNLTMLSYIRAAAKTQEGGHVEFGTTISGEFFFKGIGDLISEQRNDALNGNLPVIRMEGQEEDEVIRTQEYEKNQGFPTYFASLSSAEWYSDAIASGGGGFRSIWYDYENDTLKNKNIKYSDMNNPQLSDWSGIQSVHEKSGRIHYGGREVLTHGNTENRVIDIVDSMNVVNIPVEGSLMMHIGKLVELIIPTPPNIGSTVPTNVMYSGFYLISGVTHSIDIQKSGFTSNLTLMREGFDGKSLQGYVSSKRGKFVE